MALRSLLFVPAHHPTRPEKALATGADAVILDLEDAVPPDQKEAGRANVRVLLSHPRTCRLYLRINGLGTPWALSDILDGVRPGLDGVILPKAERPEEIAIADWTITQAERQNGMPEGSLDLIPILETAAGVTAAVTIGKASPRVRRLAFGAADFSLDLGISLESWEELQPVRSNLVITSRAANLEPPIDTVFFAVRDLAAFGHDTRLSRRMGYQGRLVIHPDQVGPANITYAPTEAEIAWARKVIEAFAAAEQSGSAAITVDGGFVDYPVVRRAERILASLQNRASP